MARYRGPDGKLVRNYGVSKDEIPKSAKLRSNNPSGQHGAERKKPSEYALQLKEKQRVRMTYGVAERQFRKYLALATRKKGVTGTILLQHLESRFDNILFRSGLIRTRRQGRQLIGHGHLLINGKKVDIPSYILKPGDVITVDQKSAELFKAFQQNRVFDPPAWVETDFENLAVRYAVTPEREDIDRTFNEQLIIEYYSR